MQYVNQLNVMVRSSPPSWTSVSTHESEIPYSINGQSLDPKQRDEIGAPSMSIKDHLEKEGRGAKLRYLRRGTTGGLKHRDPNYRDCESFVKSGNKKKIALS